MKIVTSANVRGPADRPPPHHRAGSGERDQQSELQAEEGEAELSPPKSSSRAGPPKEPAQSFAVDWPAPRRERPRSRKSRTSAHLICCAHRSGGVSRSRPKVSRRLTAMKTGRWRGTIRPGEGRRSGSSARGMRTVRAPQLDRTETGGRPQEEDVAGIVEQAVRQPGKFRTNDRKAADGCSAAMVRG